MSRQVCALCTRSARAGASLPLRAGQITHTGPQPAAHTNPSQPSSLAQVSRTHGHELGAAACSITHRAAVPLTCLTVRAQVRRGGAAGGPERGEAALLLPQPTLAVHARHAAAVQADSRWHVKLLRSALQLLLRHLQPRLSNANAAPKAATATAMAATAALTARRVPTIDMACVEPDFMQHHRQLLPSSSLRCEPTTATPHAQDKGGRAPSWPLRRRLAAVSPRGSRRRLGAAPLTHLQATAALDEMLQRINANAAAAGCGAHATLRQALLQPLTRAAARSTRGCALEHMAHLHLISTSSPAGDAPLYSFPLSPAQEMHLSGLFSMVAGSLKARTRTRLTIWLARPMMTILTIRLARSQGVVCGAAHGPRLPNAPGAWAGRPEAMRRQG